MLIGTILHIIKDGYQSFRRNCLSSSMSPIVLNLPRIEKKKYLLSEYGQVWDLHYQLGTYIG